MIANNLLPDQRLGNISDCLYRVASKAIIIQSGKLLLVKEPEGWYGLPGGGVDYGQSLQASLVREIEEELGLRIAKTQIPDKPCYVTIQANRALPRLTLFYKISDITRISDSELSGGHLSPSWASINALKTVQLGGTIELARSHLEHALRN